MYKILLADDEGIVLDSLKVILVKNFGESCEIRTAKSGRTVIETVSEFVPDIALLDIHMPGINGLDAMKEVRKLNQKIVFIVMSAYDKFAFAQEAINLGALEYITKPFTKEKVIEVLERAMKIIDEGRKKRSSELLVWEKLEAVIPVIENGFINLILFQEDFSAEMDKYRSLLDIKAENGLVITLEFGERTETGDMGNTIGTSVQLQQSGIQVREIIKEFFPKGIVGSVMANKVVFFLPCKEGQMKYEERIQVIEKARNMIHKLKNFSKIQFRAGIGNVRNFVQLHMSYEESKKALRMGKGSAIHVQDMMLGCDYAEDYPVHLEEKLFHHVKNGNVNGTKETANQFFDWMIHNYYDYQQDIQVKSLEFVMAAEKEAFLQGGMRYEFLCRKDYLVEILACDSYEELRRWFVGKVCTASRNLTAKKAEQNISVVGKAKGYIRERYNKEISLEETAKYVNISPYYFSKLFKEEEGLNFIEYLTELRIQRAKELLKSPEKSIKEICVEVGYADPNYFSRIFKKTVGATPTEYREGTGR